MATPYSRGYRAEKRVRRYFEAAGCYVMESRGSKGPIDLIALCAESGQVILVQVKRAASISERALRKLPLASAPSHPSWRRVLVLVTRKELQFIHLDALYNTPQTHDVAQGDAPASK